MRETVIVAAVAVVLFAVPVAAQQPAEADAEERPRVWLELLPELAGSSASATPMAIGIGDPSCTEYSQHPAPVEECLDDAYCMQLCESNDSRFVWTIPDRYFTQCWCVCCT